MKSTISMKRYKQPNDVGVSQKFLIQNLEMYS